MRTPLIFAAALSLLALAGCPKSEETGDFGPAKPVKNNGTLGNKPITDAAPAAPDFEHSVDVAPAFDKASNTLTVTLKLKPGFHAYAPGEEVGKPVELAVDAPWTVDGAVNIPKGTPKDMGELGKSVILEGDVPLSAKLKGGSGEIKGVVTAQVCTDKACDRPKKHPFSVPAA